MKKSSFLLIGLAIGFSFVCVGNVKASDQNVAKKLSGRILLQVQSHGEAWYVRPADLQRYYLKDGGVAYQVMRNFGVGISNADLTKIPSVKSPTEMKKSASVCLTNAIANRLKGTILLQVQKKGEAWYVDPSKCRSIYLADGAAAYQIMRYLGLGITTDNLNKINIGNIKPSEKIPNYTIGCAYNNPSCVSGARCIANKCVAIETKQLYAGKIIELKISKFDDTILAVAIDPTNNDNSFVIYSADHGKTWTPSLGMTGAASIRLAYDNFIPKRVYAVDGAKFYLSTDGGENFSQTATIDEDVNFFAASIFADKFVSNKIYIGHHNIGEKWGLYTSSNGGETFSFSSIKSSITDTSVPQILNNRIIWDLAEDPQSSNILYTTSEQATHFSYSKNAVGNLVALHYDPYYIMRTADAGKTWEPISSGLPWHSVMIRAIIDPVSHDTRWIAGTEGLGAYRLNMATKIWTKFTDGLVTDYLVIPNASSTHFLLTTSELKISKDAGNTWTTLLPSTGTTYYGAMALDSAGDLYISDYKGGIIKIVNATDL